MLKELPSHARNTKTMMVLENEYCMVFYESFTRYLKKEMPYKRLLHLQKFLY